MKTKIILIFLILSSIVFSQQAEKVLDQLQNRFSEIEDFKADFKQSLKNNFSENSQVMNGVFYYKKGNKFKVDYGDRKIISDGESIWNYDSNNKRVVINNISEDESSFTLDKIIYDYPEKCSVSKVSGDNGEYAHAIKLTPETKGLGFKSVKIWSNKNNLIRKLEVSNFNGTQIVIELNNVKLNQDLKSSEFTYNAEEGIRTIDLR
jgi:outer membrane lipoprotein carrier protein